MRAATALTTLLAACLLLAAVAAPVAADHPGEHATETPTPEEPETVEAEVDEDLRVTQYGYDGGNATFWVTLSHVGERSTKVTITEAISSDQSGAGRFGIEQLRVQPGETVTVHVSINPNAETKGVMITTPKSVAQGRGTYLQLDDGSGNMFDFAADWTIVRVTWIFGVAAAIGAIVGGAWWLVSSRHEDVEDVDLDPDQTILGGFR